MTQAHHDGNSYDSSENRALFQKASRVREHFESDEEFQEALSLWPVCPECGERRVTYCPICKVSGDLFPLADLEFWFEEEEAPVGVACHSACGCGSSEQQGRHSCHLDETKLPSKGELEQYVPSVVKPKEELSAETITGDTGLPPSLLFGELEPGVPAPRRSPIYLVQEGTVFPSMISITSDQYAKKQLESFSLEEQTKKSEQGQVRQRELKLVACYVCSEPFEPKLSGRCEGCGHHFEDIQQTQLENDGTPEYVPITDQDKWHDLIDQHHDETNPKVFAAFFLLVLLFCAAMGYLWFLFR